MYKCFTNQITRITVFCSQSECVSIYASISKIMYPSHPSFLPQKKERLCWRPSPSWAGQRRQVSHSWYAVSTWQIWTSHEVQDHRQWVIKMLHSHCLILRFPSVLNPLKILSDQRTWHWGEIQSRRMECGRLRWQVNRLLIITSFTSII